MADCYKILGNYFYNVNDVIGNGAYGKVYKGNFLPDSNTPYAKDLTLAIKEIPILLNQEGAENFKKTTLAEVEMMKQLRHPNIIRFIDVVRTENYFYIITEFCNQGSLASYVKDGKKKEIEILFYAKQLLSAFKLLSEKGIMHRDIKPENILLNNDVVKLADFGFARIIKGSSGDERTEYTIVGTPYFMSPELLEGLPYGPKNDIYSLGLTLYYCLFQKLPWMQEGVSRVASPIILFNKLKELKSIKFPFRLMPEFEDLLNNMLQFDPAQRFSWNQVFEHKLWRVDTKEIFLEKSKNNLLSTELNYAFNFDINVIRESSGNISNIFSRIQHERNICLLAFNNIRKIQYFINEIEPSLFMRINFIFCKKIAIIYELLSEIFLMKKSTLDFNNDDWLVYKIFINLTEENKSKSREYNKYLELRNLTLNEVSIAKESLQNFEKECKQYNLRNNHILEKENEENKHDEEISIIQSKEMQRQYSRFWSLLNLNLENSEIFQKEFNSLIDMILKKFKEKLFSIEEHNFDSNKNFIYMVDELWILGNPKFFQIAENKYYDLEQFYAERRECNLKEVVVRIKEAYSFFKV